MCTREMKRKEFKMKVQNVNFNNYQNKNIGFKASVNVSVHIPSHKLAGEICDDVVTVACNHVSARVNPLINKLKGKLVSQKGNSLTILYVDKTTDPDLAKIIDAWEGCGNDSAEVQISDELAAGLERVRSPKGAEQLEVVLTEDDVNLGLERLYKSDVTPDYFYRLVPIEAEY